MNNLWLISWGTGLRDGLNPCIFMTCAVFIVHGIWLKRNSVSTGWIRFFFALAYGLSFINFNFGPGQTFVCRKDFFLAAKIIYFALGTGAFVLGLKFFKDWLDLRRGQAPKDKVLPAPKTSLGKWMVFRLITVIIAVALSALSTLAPINSYMLILGNDALLKKLWQSIMPLIAGYTVFNMWPLWFVWAFLSIKNIQPSLLKIFCSAIFLTASSCMIIIFKQ